MFLHRSVSHRYVTTLLLVVVVGGLAVLAARDTGHDIQPPQPFQPSTNGATRATSRFRNLSLQPEAAKLSVRLVLMEHTHVAMGSQTGSVGNQDLLSMQIENLELEAANIGVLLSALSDQKKIPIGLEVSRNDDLLHSKTMRLQIKRGTLEDALNSIVKQNPLYTWKIQDEVVNVFPVEAKRDPFLRDVLQTKLEKFSVRRGMSRWDFRQTLCTAPAIATILTHSNVEHDIQTFMSRDLMPLGRGYGLEVSNVTVSALLNRVVRESQTHNWIVLRHGDKKEYFVLNL